MRKKQFDVYVHLFNHMSGKYMEDTATSKKLGHVILDGLHFFRSKP